MSQSWSHLSHRHNVTQLWPGTARLVWNTQQRVWIETNKTNVKKPLEQGTLVYVCTRHLQRHSSHKYEQWGHAMHHTRSRPGIWTISKVLTLEAVSGAPFVPTVLARRLLSCRALYGCDERSNSSPGEGAWPKFRAYKDRRAASGPATLLPKVLDLAGGIEGTGSTESLALNIRDSSSSTVVRVAYVLTDRRSCVSETARSAGGVSAAV